MRALVLGMLAVLLAATSADALPTRFQEDTPLTGLHLPTQIRFAPDGRVFVAEKPGLVREYSSVTDSSPRTVVDLRTDVFNFWDRGLLGMAVDPSFPTKPYLYLAYTYNRRWDGSGSWPPVDANWDTCPDPPGANRDGCDVRGRVVRVDLSNPALSDQRVLVEDWCQQHPSHSVGELAFGRDWMLYAGGGDGASINQLNLNDSADPLPNRCRDPPNEGGMLRAQDWRTTADPLGLDGSIIRIDPATGNGVAGNPGYTPTTAATNKARIIAYGLRNPYRFSFRPGTSELWLGDVGWNTRERIYRVADTTPASPPDFGWPCYEGTLNARLMIPICAQMYASETAAPGSVLTRPYFEYTHNQAVVPGQTCGVGTSGAVTGVAFAPAGGSFPPPYRGALFFADYSHNCIYTMPPGVGGLPDVSRRQVFESGAATPVDLEFGPGGALYYVDIIGGEVHRLRYFAADQPPIARIAADTRDPYPVSRPVRFTALGSRDPEGDTLTYAWDLDGDGNFGEVGETGPSPTFTYLPGTYRPDGRGNVQVRLRISDQLDATSYSAPLEIRPGNRPPIAAITSPAAGARWSADERIGFTGAGIDPDQGLLPGSGMSWDFVLHHCPSSCHLHPVQSLNGAASGSFVAQDHELPSYLELRLTVTDARGATATRTLRLDPRTIRLRVLSDPPGRPVSLAGRTGTAPLTRTVIAGARVAVSAAVSNGAYRFQRWSDGVTAASRTLTAPRVNTDIVARYMLTPKPGSSDETPPKLLVGGARRQATLRTNRIVLSLRCKKEACTARADHSLRLNGTAGYRLRSRAVPLVAGARGRMTLRLTSATLRAARAAAGRRGKLKVKIRLYATDAAGNVGRDTRNVVLVR
jgi:glucose/arabinose dehydrogenase